MDNRFVFEYDITDYCNLNCAGCSHYAPIGENKNISAQEAEIELRKLSKVLDKECSLIHIMGGEPLLNKEIIDILSITRNYFPLTRIQLVTNGILLPNMEVNFWKRCSELNIEISLTLYPIKIDIQKIKELSSKYNTVVNPYRNGKYFNRYLIDEKDKQDKEESFNNCELKKCHLYRDGKLYQCSITGCIYKLNRYFNSNIEVLNDNYIEINENTKKEEILEFINKPHSFCKHCLVNTWNETFDWTISKKDIKEWIY